MQSSENWLASLEAALPAAWQVPVQQLADAVLEPERPIRVVLAGAFTVGKSSLINMLSGRDWLPAALEETTALPTFIEYGANGRTQLVNVDGSARDLSAEAFAAAVVQAPPNTAYGLLSLDQQWLVGVTLVDLPGLGGMSQANQQFSLAQIQQADVVLYLIAPRGPDTGDVAVLRRIRDLGKHVAVLATRWDEVERAAAAGEKAVDLLAWADEVDADSQLRTSIMSVSKYGTGREDVIAFIRAAHGALADIRLQRLRAELKPLLENALGHNALMQGVCRSDGEEARQAAHAELLRRKQALTELKAALHAQASADRAASAAAAEELTQRHGKALNAALSGLDVPVTEETRWAAFVAEGTQMHDRALDALARDLQELTAAYGVMKISTSQQQEFHLHLPPLQPVESEDLLHIGRMAALQRALEEKQEAHRQLEHAFRDGDSGYSGNQRQLLHQAMRERDALLTQTLPRIMQPVSNNTGAAIGRAVGELADIGAMFINPTVAGGKVAAVIGKAAKLAKISVDTNKVAKAASKTFKIIKATKVTGGKVPGVPPSVIDKLGMLEAISLSYWGERIGSALDGPQEISVVDPEAFAQQQAAIRAADARMQAVRTELARIARLSEEAKLTSWAMEQNRKEQALLKADLDEAAAWAQQQAREFQAQQEKDRAQLIVRHVEQALAHWSRSYAQQSAAMIEVLRQQVKGHWEQQVDGMLRERLDEIAELSSAVDAAPAEQQVTLAALQTEAESLRTGMRLLTP